MDDDQCRSTNLDPDSDDHLVSGTSYFATVTLQGTGTVCRAGGNTAQLQGFSALGPRHRNGTAPGVLRRGGCYGRY